MLLGDYELSVEMVFRSNWIDSYSVVEMCQ